MNPPISKEFLFSNDNEINKNKKIMLTLISLVIVFTLTITPGYVLPIGELWAGTFNLYSCSGNQSQIIIFPHYEHLIPYKIGCYP